jgi:biopolymer transport protein ExbD
MNLVPLIDVLFILLIFFIVTFAMARFETELNISVPAAESGTDNARRVGEIVVNIRKDGTIVVTNNVLTPAMLLEKFQETARFNRKQAIIIRGDETTHLKNVVEVLSLAHQTGLHHVSFATTRPQTP